jgi:hypothetical protein
VHSSPGAPGGTGISKPRADSVNVVEKFQLHSFDLVSNPFDRKKFAHFLKSQHSKGNSWRMYPGVQQNLRC